MQPNIWRLRAPPPIQACNDAISPLPRIIVSWQSQRGEPQCNETPRDIRRPSRCRVPIRQRCSPRLSRHRAGTSTPPSCRRRTSSSVPPAAMSADHFALRHIEPTPNLLPGLGSAAMRLDLWGMPPEEFPSSTRPVTLRTNPAFVLGDVGSTAHGFVERQVVVSGRQQWEATMTLNAFGVPPGRAPKSINESSNKSNNKSSNRKSSGFLMVGLLALGSLAMPWTAQARITQITLFEPDHRFWRLFVSWRRPVRGDQRLCDRRSRPGKSTKCGNHRHPAGTSKWQRPRRLST